MKYAPVVLFTYNRIDELKVTLQELKNNIAASKSDLIIYSDAARNDRETKDVDEVRSYIRKIDGFKSVNIIERPENFGLAKSIIRGITEVLSHYGKVIVLEDDLVTSPNFLCYMNQALEFYENNEKIFSISGFTMPLKSLKNLEKDTYVSLRPSSWGWATWKDRWKDIDWEIKDYEEFIKDKNAVRSFNLGGADLTRMLRHYKQGRNNSWAIRWAYAMFRMGKYSIYPKISKVENIGFGANATHCKGTNIYRTVLDDFKSCRFDFLDKLEPDEAILNDFKYQYSYRNKFAKRTLDFFRKY